MSLSSDDFPNSIGHLRRPAKLSAADQVALNLVHQLNQESSNEVENQLRNHRGTAALSVAMRDQVDVALVMQHPNSLADVLVLKERLKDPTVQPMVFVNALVQSQLNRAKQAQQNPSLLERMVAAELLNHITDGHWAHGVAKDTIEALNVKQQQHGLTDQANTEGLLSLNDQAKRKRAKMTALTFAETVSALVTPDENKRNKTREYAFADHPWVRSMANAYITVSDALGSCVTHVTPTGHRILKR